VVAHSCVVLPGLDHFFRAAGGKGTLEPAQLALEFLDLAKRLVEVGARGHVKRFAREAGRPLQLLAMLGRGADHLGRDFQPARALHRLVQRCVDTLAHRRMKASSDSTRSPRAPIACSSRTNLACPC